MEVIERDEFKFEESKKWPYFTEGATEQIVVTGFILLPGKILIAVGRSIPDLIEYPCICIARDDWKHPA